jgi:5-oxoprolinase (ATP-hydrolysing) subunit A
MSSGTNIAIPARLVKFDLNCDLGENEPPARTAALMRYVTSANIACGGHAGDVESMRAAVKLALKNKVQIGAHPGLNDRANFGRIAQAISPAELKTLVLQQVSALERVAHDAGARLHHIKLHGALYHMVEEQNNLRRAFLEGLQEFWPSLTVYSIAGGEVARGAARAGLKSSSEGFLDRGYTKDGRLIPRTQPGAVLTLSEFAQRLESLQRLPIKAKTWCIHSDTKDAIEFARRAKVAFSL